MINSLAVCVSGCLMLCSVESALYSLTLFARAALFLCCAVLCAYLCRCQYFSVYHRLAI